MDLMGSMAVSGGGMLAQSLRMKVAAENIANEDSVQDASGAGPYRAKQIFFREVLNKATGASEVQVANVSRDMKTPLKAVYNPNSELADAKGFVMMPNVDGTLEAINMKEAQRAYEANMAALATAKDMAAKTLDLLK